MLDIEAISFFSVRLFFFLIAPVLAIPTRTLSSGNY